MAAVGILQSPHNLDNMSRRAPLGNLPQAANSPIRPAAGKRARAETHTVLDDLHAPPAKRHHIDPERGVEDRENVPPQPQTPHKKKAVSSLDARLVKQGANPQAVERERALRHLAVKEKVREVVDVNRREKQRHLDARLDDISRWQRYYEKQFPKFVFYFENIPEEARRHCSRHVRELGAQEDRFFSRAVTHVITTRSLPTEAATHHEEQQAVPGEECAHHNGTINPSLLDRRNRTFDGLTGTGRIKFGLDGVASRKAALGASPEKASKITAKGDVLIKARDLGIKIWQLEKLQRILRVMFYDDDVSESPEQESRRIGRGPKQTNLSQLIKNEQRSQAGVREIGPMQGELILLNEPYIFVRDFNEKTKPLMVRQYQKVSKAEDGDWPQFRAVTQGKCPFILEEPKRKMTATATENVETAGKKDDKNSQRTTRAQAAAELLLKRPVKRTYDDLRREDAAQDTSNTTNHHVQRHPLAELGQILLRGRTAENSKNAVAVKDDEENVQDEQQVEEGEGTEETEDAQNATTDAVHTTTTPPLTTETAVIRSKMDHHNFASHSRQGSFDLMAPPAALPQPNPRIGLPGGEPLASGLQKSGMTSAIRSQMISSTAAAPGIKAGMSRDIHSLQRRILERNSTGSGSALGMSAPVNGPSGTSAHATNAAAMSNSRAQADTMTRIRPENPRAAKTRAVEKLNVHGRTGEYPDDAEGGRAREEKERHKSRYRREPKPGYCENCREKFDDFEVHIQSRKHRKFAQTKENWAELDELLLQLQRPLKKTSRHSQPADLQDEDLVTFQ